jgi:putative transposase
MATPKSSPRPANNQSLRLQPAAAAHPPTDCALRTRFCPAQLLRRFHHLLPATLLARWLAQYPQSFYQRAFTPRITLWYFLFQRLHHHHALSGVVQDARDGGADRLSPKGKRLSTQLSSEATTSFSDARQRLPQSLLRRCLRHFAQCVGQSFETALWLGHKVALADGSTLRMRPLGDLPQHFRPHRPGNCKKEPYWCVSRVVGMFCLATGVLLDSAMAGLKTSEQALCSQLLQTGIWDNWVLVADRNFGVYSVVGSARQVRAHVVCRLTQARAAKLARLAGVLLKPGLDVRVCWRSGKQDQCPQHLERQPVQGRLMAIGVRRGGRALTLYLFTTLLDRQKYTAQALAQLYGQRWKVELYLRHVKAQMDLGFLQCGSAEMAHKEWLAGLLAYNLIRYTMAAAAALAEVPLQVLSFSRARELLLGWLQRASFGRPTRPSWQRLLTRIANARLCKRPKPRPSEPRALRSFQNYFPKLEGSRAQARQNLTATCSKS